MRVYDSLVTNERMKKLREAEHFSQQEMAHKLKEKMSEMHCGKSLVLDGESGKQVISQFERTRKPSLDVIFAYAHIFGVSVDYLTGWADEMRPNYKSAREELFLGNRATKNLEMLALKSHPLHENGEPDYSKTFVAFGQEINAFIRHKSFNDLMLTLARAIDVTDDEYITFDDKKAYVTTEEAAKYSIFSNFEASKRELFADQFTKITRKMYDDIVKELGKEALSFTVDMTEAERDEVRDKMIEQEDRENMPFSANDLE